jgi:hypothetical protein
MRFISIEEHAGTEKVLVNVAQISSINASPTANTLGFQRIVNINMANGQSVQTKFTSIGHAIDYIQRARSVSLECP